jgi:hypothetical protein
MFTNQPQKKSFLDNLTYISISLSVLIIVGGLLLILFSEELPLEGIFSPSKMEVIDFETLAIVPDQNHYLSCPEDYCLMATSDQITIVYPVTVDVLSLRFLDFIDAQPRVEKNTKRWDIPNRQFEYLAYSGPNPFPDVVTVQFYDLGGNHSSLAILSRTLKGEDRNNANKNRVNRWLSTLDSE